MISIYTWMHERNEKRNVKKQLLMALCSPKSRAPGSVKGLVQIIYPGGGGGQGGVATGSGSRREGKGPVGPAWSFEGVSRRYHLGGTDFLQSSCEPCHP